LDNALLAAAAGSSVFSVRIYPACVRDPAWHDRSADRASDRSIDRSIENDLAMTTTPKNEKNDAKTMQNGPKMVRNEPKTARKRSENDLKRPENASKSVAENDVFLGRVLWAG